MPCAPTNRLAPALLRSRPSRIYVTPWMHVNSPISLVPHIRKVAHLDETILDLTPLAEMNLGEGPQAPPYRVPLQRRTSVPA